MTDQERMDELVREAFEHGSLAHRGVKTISIAGKRRHYVRVQSVIFTRFHGADVGSSDEFMVPLVDESLRRVRGVES